MSSPHFDFDIFLSYSAQDHAVVHLLAERLKRDGLRIWLDAWEIQPGDNIPSKIEDGLEKSRVLVFCMSENAFGSDWVILESQTFRFRDPLNKGRRFVPLRLDDTVPKGSLRQFSYVDWRNEKQDSEYVRLLRACWPLDAKNTTEVSKTLSGEVFPPGDTNWLRSVTFSRDGKHILSGTDYNTIYLWKAEGGAALLSLEGQFGRILSVAFDSDGKRALSGGDDKMVRLWDLRKGRALCVLKGHTDRIMCVAFSSDGKHALSGGGDKTLRLWDLEKRRTLYVLEGHTDRVMSVALSSDGKHALSGGGDKTLRLWDLEKGLSLYVLEGHTDRVMSVALSLDGKRALSGSDDKTVRLWDIGTQGNLRIFEGHTGVVRTVTFSPDGRYALSGSDDKTVRFWDVENGHSLCTFEGHTGAVMAVAFSPDGKCALSGAYNGVWRSADLSLVQTDGQVAVAGTLDQLQYANAKVLLVGESGSGKTGLAKRLALNEWQPTDSTVGAWATQWKLPVTAQDSGEREIWLWDFGGQADQRLIHQLYMGEASMAVLVFDGQKENLFEMLRQWDRDLTRSTHKPFTKVLAAGRVDAGGLRISRDQIDAFIKERGFTTYVETSAKFDWGCRELKEAILSGIHWAEIPWRSSPRLFKRLKDEIITLKDKGRVLMRFNELSSVLRLRLIGEEIYFKDEQLKEVIGLLTGPGVVLELLFGSWILLQPERVNAYAQAVIRSLRDDPHERGCIPEERVLRGELKYQSSLPRLPEDEERIVLHAMHQTMVRHGLCLREPTDTGMLLIFPSYYRRERPELIEHPAVLVTYRFSGFLDDIYATLVVRLHHTKSFEQDKLWRYAADFRTLTRRQLGIKLTRLAEGQAELNVYFEPEIPLEEKIIFSRYIHEHLLQKAHNVVRLRHYICPHCGTTVESREVALQKLKEGKKEILCVNCEKRVPLWDKIEERFDSVEIQQRVREIDWQSRSNLDIESEERTFIGEIVSTVVLAGQIIRELSVSDRGIAMEIEFKSNSGEASGKKLYLVLDSNPHPKVEVQKAENFFPIGDKRHVRYWMERPFPVMLMTRNSGGEIRWTELRTWWRVREWLQRNTTGMIPPADISVEGERFDVVSVRRWRDKMLGLAISAAEGSVTV